VTLILAAVGLSFSSCQTKKLIGALVILVGSAFVFWKTVIYIMYSHDFTTSAVKSLSLDAVLYFVIPSSFWIICPLLTIYSVIKNVVGHVKSLTNDKKD
jgi:hypothetical protein